MAGIENPVAKAGTSTVARAIYDHDESEVTTVEQMITQKINDGAEFFELGDDEEEEDDDSSSSGVQKASEPRYVCKDMKDEGCSWSATGSEAEVRAKNFLVCPECDGQIEQIDPGE